MYRIFLKCTKLALGNSYSRQVYVQRRIRNKFEEYKKEKDPTKLLQWERKSRNTLELFIIACKREGIELDIIRNLGEFEFYQEKLKYRATFQNRKLSNDIRQLHELMDHDLQTVIEMLNEELDLCL